MTNRLSLLLPKFLTVIPQQNIKPVLPGRIADMEEMDLGATNLPGSAVQIVRGIIGSGMKIVCARMLVLDWNSANGKKVFWRFSDLKGIVRT